ncbi:band 4.1-like protein 5 [Vombatus ursinus]|uniref:band 4.1-like protein 5 n=1 Tax=Vombatus ursinus TaxID=29139 RepID=UPI000FFD5F6C|nr:band 4.1-like protein 5 [Vombatus ursinus]
MCPAVAFLGQMVDVFVSFLPLTDLLDNTELLQTADEEAKGVPGTLGISVAPEEISMAAIELGVKEANVESSEFKDSSMKLKLLEIENCSSSSAKPNININVNKQEEVVKLTEKCLNNVIESPGLPSLRIPPDIKSNILKAQVEAVHKVTREDDTLSQKNSNVQDNVFSNVLKEDNKILSPENTVIPTHPNAVEDNSVLKSATDELDALLSSLTENLIDLTAVPPQTRTLSNGISGNEVPVERKEECGDPEVLSLIAQPGPFLVDAVTTSVPGLAEEALRKQRKCLLTTEL